MSTAQIAECIKHCGVQGICLARPKIKKRQHYNLFMAAIIVICITVTSGVCSKALSLNHPIFIENDTQQVSSATQMEREAQAQSAFYDSMNKKYPLPTLRFPANGVAHVRATFYINSKPIKINIVEIDTSANSALEIRPEIAGEKLNSRAQIRKIAQKSNAVAAVNAGYFKPQTGVPLGALMVDGEVLTGPIYDRTGIGIINKDGKTTYTMGKVKMDVQITTSKGKYKADNINQPRMLSTYTLIYTPKWGKMSPMAPKYGKVAAVRGGKIIGMSANQIEIPQDGFVISAPKHVFDSLVYEKNIKYEVSLDENFKNARHIIGAGPRLVKNGELYVNAAQERLSSITGRNPRSAIGYTKTNRLIIVTIDGREEASVGVTIWDLAKVMKGLGCENAMNFDGGGSSVMYVNGSITNSPAQQGGISISNALVVSTKS